MVLFSICFYPSILPGIEAPSEVFETRMRAQRTPVQGHDQAARSKAHRDARLNARRGNFEL
jgi:hypothetical protein